MCPGREGEKVGEPSGSFLHSLCHLVAGTATAGSGTWALGTSQREAQGTD